MLIDCGARKVVKYVALCTERRPCYLLSRMAGDKVEHSMRPGTEGRYTAGRIKFHRCCCVKRLCGSIHDERSDQRITIRKRGRLRLRTLQRKGEHLELACRKREGCLGAAVGPAAAQRNIDAQTECSCDVIRKVHSVYEFRRKILIVLDAFGRVVKHE